ncbi:MAG: response regulator [Xanthobacteraceae bacterium]
MRHSVVVAEDEPHLVEALTFLMRRAGFAVNVATDGPSAIDLVRRVHPDLVLLDIMLPGCDGFEVLARLRADPATRNIRVVVLTAKGREQDNRRARELGADDYITKPFDNSDVVARVSSLLAPAAERCNR